MKDTMTAATFRRHVSRVNNLGADNEIKLLHTILGTLSCNSDVNEDVLRRLVVEEIDMLEEDVKLVRKTGTNIKSHMALAYCAQCKKFLNNTFSTSEACGTCHTTITHLTLADVLKNYENQ